MLQLNTYLNETTSSHEQSSLHFRMTKEIVQEEGIINKYNRHDDSF